MGILSSPVGGGGRRLVKPSEFGSRGVGMFAVIMYMCGVRWFSFGVFMFCETTATIGCHGINRYTEDDDGQPGEL